MTPEQLRTYWADGFLSAIACLTTTAALELRRELHAAVGGTRRAPGVLAAGELQHPIYRWLRRLAGEPAIISPVVAVLGTNVFLRNVDIVVRQPLSPLGTGWHRDSPFDEPAVDRLVTAWVGLSPSYELNGCMRLVRGSHRAPPTPSATPWWRRNTDPELRRDVGGIDRSLVVANRMPLGCMSLHHMRTIHASGGNFTLRPRIGVVMRFYAGDADPRVAGAGEGMLVSGAHDDRRFQLLETCPVRWST